MSNENVGANNVQTTSVNNSNTNTGSTSESGKLNSNIPVSKTDSKESKEPKQTAEQQVEQAIKKYKLKIDGKEEEVDENEVVRLAQLGKSAYKKFQEAAAERKKIEEFKQALKKDFIGTLQKHGEEFGMTKEQIRNMIEDYLLEQLRYEQMTPEEKKAYEMEKKLKEYEEKERMMKEEQEYQEFLAKQKEYEKYYEQTFTEALNKNNIPVNPYTISRMAMYMEQALQNGFELDPIDCARLVQEDYQLELKDMFEKMQPEQIINFLGKDVINKIKQYEIKNIKNKYVQTSNEPKEKEETPKKSERKWKDFLSRLDALEKGEADI